MSKPELVRFETRDGEMAVRLAGDREKPALLVIHGLPSVDGLLAQLGATIAARR